MDDADNVRDTMDMPLDFILALQWFSITYMKRPDKTPQLKLFMTKSLEEQMIKMKTKHHLE